MRDRCFVDGHSLCREVCVDVTDLAFAYKHQPLRARLIDTVAWYNLTDLCALLGRPSPDEAIAFVTASHPQRLRQLVEGGGSAPWIDDDGLWSIVSLAGYHVTDDLARWLLLEVAPKVRHAMYEQTPNGNASDVRELWHVIDQLIDIGEMRDYGRDTEMLAINLTDAMLAALRHGLPLPSKARMNRFLTLSRTPQYRGRTYVTHHGREIPCLAFDRTDPGLSPDVHQSASRATS